MLRRSVLVGSLLLLGTAGTSLHAATGYSVNPISAPIGWSFVGALAINNSGQIAGTGDNTTGLSQAFIGGVGGTTPIPLPVGYIRPFTVAFGLNDSGQVVGYGYINGAYDQAFIGTAGGVTAIPLPSGWSETFGSGINNSGQVAGYGYNGITDQAFIATAGSIEPIPLFEGWVDSYGNGINDYGQVTGAGDYGTTVVLGHLQTTQLAFIATTEGITPIPLPAGWSQAAGVGINNLGEVAGYGYVGVGPNTTQLAFIGTAGEVKALPLLAGWKSMYVNYPGSINSSSQVVGEGVRADGSSGGWIWDDFNGTQDLNSLVPAGWTILSANSINDAGQIVAIASNSSGFMGSVVLTPGSSVNSNSHTCTDLVSGALHLYVSPDADGNLTTGMAATFTPNFGLSLQEAAVICGGIFATGFSWQQTVTAVPTPTDLSYCTDDTCFYANAQPLVPLIAPISDPPDGGGYTYEPYFDASFPFYCTPSTDPLGRCTFGSNSLIFGDRPADLAMNPDNNFAPPATNPTGTFMAFTTSLVLVLSDNKPGPPLFHWTWISTFDGSVGGVSVTANTAPVDPGSGTGGVTVTSINGVQLPTALSPSQIATTASGLAYSRVSQTYNGTVTLTNRSNSTISGPLQMVLFGMTPNITLTNATGNLSGTPYLTVPTVGGLAPGQSITINVQFKNPSNATITFTPVIYSGSLN